MSDLCQLLLLSESVISQLFMSNYSSATSFQFLWKLKTFYKFMQGFEDTLNIVEKDESKKETLKCIFFYVGLVVLEKNLVNGKVDVPSFRGSFMYYTLVLSVWWGNETDLHQSLPSNKKSNFVPKFTFFIHFDYLEWSLRIWTSSQFTVLLTNSNF